MILVSDFNAKEVVLLAGKLRLLAEDVGLTDDEVGSLICLRLGTWPMTAATCDGWRPTAVEERRLRMLVEVLCQILTMMGQAARMWLRLRNHGLGVSPARFLLSEPGALPALRDVLRHELRDY